MKKISFLILFFYCFVSQSFGEDRYFEIRAKKFSYTPGTIKVHKGDHVRIRLISEDVAHGIFIDGYELNTAAIPGQDGSLAFTADKTGRFTFRCSVTCGEFHPYMVGKLIVGPNSRFIFYALLTLCVGLVSVVLMIKRRS